MVSILLSDKWQKVITRNILTKYIALFMRYYWRKLPKNVGKLLHLQYKRNSISNFVASHRSFKVGFRINDLKVTRDALSADRMNKATSETQVMCVCVYVISTSANTRRQIVIYKYNDSQHPSDWIVNKKEKRNSLSVTGLHLLSRSSLA